MRVVIVHFAGSSYQIMSEDHEPLEDFMRKLPDAKRHCKKMGWSVMYIQESDGTRRSPTEINYGGKKWKRNK